MGRVLIWLALMIAGAWTVLAVFAQAQGPTPPVPCEDRLNTEMYNRGALLQELAVTRAQLAGITKERDELKAQRPTPSEKK